MITTRIFLLEWSQPSRPWRDGKEIWEDGEFFPELMVEIVLPDCQTNADIENANATRILKRVFVTASEFERVVIENPKDWQSRFVYFVHFVYADWLEEHGRIVESRGQRPGNESKEDKL